MKELITMSVRETVALGIKLGEILESGDVVCLNGDLGTGKTALANGIAEALGVAGYITSPTFTIVNEYKGRIPFYHFDVYRIMHPDEMFEIGFEEYINGDGVVVIEWADLIADILPDEYIRVDIRKDPGNLDSRIITIEFKGEKYRGREDMLPTDNI